jgi:hypothetical protein
VPLLVAIAASWLRWLCAAATIGIRSLAAEPNQLPSNAEARAVCELVASAGAYSNLARIAEGLGLRTVDFNELARDLAAAPERKPGAVDVRQRIDLDNDGTDDTARPAYSGTARFLHVWVRWKSEGEEAYAPIAGQLPEGDFRWLRGMAALTWGRQTYLILYADQATRFPGAIVYLDSAQNTLLVCEFGRQVARTMRPISPAWHALCRRAGGLTAAGRIAFAAKPSISADMVGRQLEVSETHPRGAAVLDFDNDGQPDTIVALEYSSGAGPGCAITYFALSDTKTEKLLLGERNERLLRLQHMPHRQCHFAHHAWFRHAGKVYFERYFLDSDLPRFDESFIHDVFLIERDKTSPVCTADFRVSHSIKQYGVVFR